MSSPSSLTACTTSTSKAFSERKRKLLNYFGFEHFQPQTEYLYLDTGVSQSDLREVPLKITGTMAVENTKKGHRKNPKTPLGTEVSLNGESIALFLYNREVYAILNKCCHQGGNLSMGDIEDLALPSDYSDEPSQHSRTKTLKSRPCIICPRHGWKFDLKTGTCIQNNEYVQEVFPIEITHGKISVGFKKLHDSCFDPKQAEF